MTLNRRIQCSLSGLLLIFISAYSSAEGGHKHHHALPQGFSDLMEKSMAEKFGLEFYVDGQVIPGVVTKLPGDGTVEVRNQSRDRIVIRLRRVSAIGR